MKIWVKIALWSLVALLLVGGALGFYVYKIAFGRNIVPSDKARAVDIPNDAATYEAVAERLAADHIIEDKASFVWTASLMKYKVKAGRYRLQPDATSNHDLIATLRGGQMTIKLTLHNIRTKEQLAGRLATDMIADSLSFLRLFNDTAFLQTHQLTPQTVMTIFIPNTYDMYWNTDAKGLFDKMLQERNKFWTEERKNKAKTLNLSPEQVYTLASIVETESQYQPERPRIAGVYLNRLRQNWRLEADPTVVFAVGDFEIRRVLKSHLETDSPYNTYKNEGLPPGPIYMASINAIDAVLNAETHEYMFFCAKPDLSGAHNFAKTLDAHNANAREYHRWLNSQR